MRISAKADYAIRAVVEIAGAHQERVKGERIAQQQSVPLKFLENILVELKHAGIVQSQRGTEGGYSLARPAQTIALADIIRAIDGPLANVRGVRPESLEYEGHARPLQEVWIAVRASVRSVLESVSVADVVNGTLPESVKELTTSKDAWLAH